jgi:hypothetical protein
MGTKTIEIIVILVFAATVIFFLLRMFKRDVNEDKEENKSVTDDFMYWRH